ncbi:PREDICTED: growth hormone-inducible transmembrane protein-like [Nicrophorus vespilloides]|uniref:Growth hormone-inducible transmembrane protein-like n=1 Tax=Nicrophorus vespilloides TaxID=110193 RepID=A0ABM1M572_NICVS|nr:PREDICTED: growth hormone-inducible transmembrane protein-like [Nicrophorus vespilloides]XP_017769721.1 PREDICTED: growth hormone-inducible transmembrane protein-like [Nicrophorus vespilloides]XP_017769722.1 PREDICTED: growth hormone-inducible transmembrane protein-like [Nicrophorus vespilloides]
MMSSILVSRLCCSPSLRLAAARYAPKNNIIVRNFTRNERDTIQKTARKPTLKEKLMAPAGDSAFKIGKGALAGGAALGIGALCFYGLGLSNQAGALEKSAIWPQFVMDRIKQTYLYFGGSIAITAAAALASFRSPAIMRLVTSNGPMGFFVSIAAIMGTGILCQSIDYSQGFGPKQMAWLLHAGTMGAVLAPMCYLGGPLLMTAAWYTVGVVGGLSTIAVCAPSEKFLMMGGPLAMGLGVVFASSIGSAFLPATSALGAGLYSVSLYGGLLLFSAFLLYDTQRIIAQAERYPTSPALYGVRPYDPINSALSIYMDTLNIFIRIVSIMTGAGGNRKR